MKKFLSFLYRFAFSIVVVIYLLVAPNFIIKKLIYAQNNINGISISEFSGVIEMWHIESFEGGSASRSSWLLKRVQEFEKQHKGVFISIVNLSLETAKLNLQNGKKPSLISFPLGLGDELNDTLLEYKGKKLGLEKLVLAGKHNKKQLAVPYMLGGYCLFSLSSTQSSGGKTPNQIIAGLNSSSFTSVALSMELENQKNAANNIEQSSYLIDSYLAYDGFIKGKGNTLLGTQRDFYRINNRIEKGSLPSCEFKYCNFTDLVQYMGICKGVSENIYNLSQSFIEYIISSKVQSTIKDINMFSVLESVYESDNKKLNVFEKTLKQNIQTINVFLKTDEILKLKNEAQSFIKGEKSSLSEIKKYLI